MKAFSSFATAGALSLLGCSADLGDSDKTGAPKEPAPGDDLGTGGSGTDPQDTPVVNCEDDLTIPAAPLRRLTRFEYSKTVKEVLGDDTSPGNNLPSELLGNGFGNDAAEQPVSSFLAEQYASVAEDVATRAVQSQEFMARYAACASAVFPQHEENCARTFVESFGPRAFRHPLDAEDVEDLLELFRAVRSGGDFTSSISAVIEAILQSPDFLYRLEFGEQGEDEIRRPTNHEMAARLSYLFWGSSPDDELIESAEQGVLTTEQGIEEQATRLLRDERTRETVQFFFDHFLPIQGLSDLSRDPAQFPTFNSRIGSLMRRETQTFLEHVFFDGPGDYQSALTAPYTFLNAELAEFYGVSGVDGAEFRQVTVDPTQRRGFLTQGAILAGTTISNVTNPVRRGVFLLHDMMCLELPEPPDSIAAAIMPPDPYSGATGRERYSAHSEQAACAKCHALMDPPGFALENYDAVGLWRDRENGVMIDASGEISALAEPFSGPLELIQLIAEADETYACFAHKWLDYAFGRSLSQGDPKDACLREDVTAEFVESGHDVQSLLLALTQTDAFLHLPTQELSP